MSHIKAVPLSQLSKYSSADDEIVLMSSTDEQPADAEQMRTALGLGTAATIDASQTGGANKVAQYNSIGGLQLTTGSISGDALISGDGLGSSTGGPAYYVQDKGRIWFLNLARSSGGSIFYDSTHGADGGELQINSPHRIAMCLGPYGALQLGLATDAAVNMQYAYLQSRGGATASITSTSSLPLYFQPTRYNGSSGVPTQAPSIIGTPDGTTGDAFLDFSAVGAQPNNYGADGARTLNMRLSKNGVWEAGKAPTFDTLTATANVFTQACSIYKSVQAAKLTLGATNSLEFSGAAAGMRGVIYVSQDSTGSRLLTLPTGSRKTGWPLSTAASAVDKLQWEFDGSYYYFTATKAFELEQDADATAFVARASLSDAPKEAAINAFVVGLKVASLWSKFTAIYPFVGGTATSHSKNLKADAYNITNDGSAAGLAWQAATHNADGVTGNGAAYGNTTINPFTVGLTTSAHLYIYSKTTTPTDFAYFAGATTGTERFALARSGASLQLHGLNSSLNTTVTAASDFSNHFALQRMTSSTNAYMIGSVYTASTDTYSAATIAEILLLGRRNSGTPGGFTNANLAMVSIGTHLTESEWTTFRGLVDAYQTALGRAN